MHIVYFAVMDNLSSESVPQNKLLSIGKASEYLGISIDTLRRWEKKGKLVTLRSPGEHRYFSKDNLDAVFGSKYERSQETKPRAQYQTIKETIEIPISEEVPAKVEEKTDLITEPEIKEVGIPKTEYIKIIQPDEDLFPSPSINENIAIGNNYIAPAPAASTSILEPPTVAVQPISQQPQAPTPKNEPFNFINFFSEHYAIVIVAIIILLFLVFVLIYFLTTPEKIISPII